MNGRVSFRYLAGFEWRFRLFVGWREVACSRNGKRGIRGRMFDLLLHQRLEKVSVFRIFLVKWFSEDGDKKIVVDVR